MQLAPDHVFINSDGVVVRALTSHQCDQVRFLDLTSYMWVEFVVGSRSCSVLKVFLLVLQFSPLLKNPTFLNSNYLIWKVSPNECSALNTLTLK